MTKFVILDKLGTFGKKGQIGLFDIFALNYVRKRYLRHIGIDRIEK